MESVLFDPGYHSCLLGVSESVEFMYDVFDSSYMPLKQKKFQFSIIAQKIKNMLKKNVAFYLGCLFWATYIKKEENAQIENNPCLDDVYDEENALSEVRYLINFIKEKFPKDAKFYINKTIEIDKRFLVILEAYEEFVKLNKGFVSLKNTSELLLPSNIKDVKTKDYQKIKDFIDAAISNKDLTNLYEIYDLILD